MYVSSCARLAFFAQPEMVTNRFEANQVQQKPTKVHKIQRSNQSDQIFLTGPPPCATAPTQRLPRGLARPLAGKQASKPRHSKAGWLAGWLARFLFARHHLASLHQILVTTRAR